MGMRACITSVTILATVLSSPALAQDKGAKNKQANALWIEGKRLVDSGDIAAGCKKFEQSLALIPKLGTRLNLADCYEKLGSTASAWDMFRAATEQAHEQADDREAFARERAAALGPRLSRLTIGNPRGSVPGLQVTRDGAPIPASALDQALPVDPGEHIIAASAPDHQTWETRVMIQGDHQMTTVTIPPLERIGAPPPPPVAAAATPTAVPKAAEDLSVQAAPAARGSSGKTLRIAGLAAGGVGVVGIAAGVYFGVRAKSLADQVSGRFVTADDEAGKAANRNMFIGYGIGAAGLITGGILYYLGSRTPSDAGPVVSVGSHEVVVTWVY
jgi:hypothetical protein